MKGRKLLDAHLFNGLKKITKTIVTNVVVPRIFEIFFSFHYFIHTQNRKAYICSTIFYRL